MSVTVVRATRQPNCRPSIRAQPYTYTSAPTITAPLAKDGSGGLNTGSGLRAAADEPADTVATPVPRNV